MKGKRSWGKILFISTTNFEKGGREEEREEGIGRKVQYSFKVYSNSWQTARKEDREGRKDLRDKGKAGSGTVKSDSHSWQTFRIKEGKKKREEGIEGRLVQTLLRAIPTLP